MTFYVALLMCFAAASGQHCEWRSLPEPVAEPNAYWGKCMRSPAARKAGSWQMGPLICSTKPLDPERYPPAASSVPRDRFA